MIPTEIRHIMGAAFLMLALLFLMCSVVGFVAGLFWSCKSDVDGKACEIFAWSSLVAWVIPVIGFAVSAVVYQFSKKSDENESNYFWMANICGLASLANAGIGIYLDLQEQGSFA